MKLKSQKKKFKKILLLIILSTLLLPVAVLALENQYPDILGNVLPPNPDVADYVGYFANIGISISLILATLVIIFGGLQYIVYGALGKSGGEGKEWIKSGVLGLFLLVSAYTILATINPTLVNPTFGKLLNNIPFIDIPISDLVKGPPITYYKEIPMGTLTETVLSRKISCYKYDDLGDPIQVQVKIDSGGSAFGPSYLDHDRVDCMFELNQAIEKKTKIVKDLSIKIAQLMNSCNCQKSSSESTSTTPQTTSTNCTSTGDCPSPTGVIEVCEEDAYCGRPLPCDCSGSCETNPEEFEMCEKGVKKLVTEGPIEIGGLLDWPDFVATILVGQNNLSGGLMTYTDSLYKCMTLSDKMPKLKKYKGLQEFGTTLNTQGVIKLIDTKVKSEGRDVTLMNKTNWDNLKLVEQLMYLKEKLSELTTTLSQDNQRLSLAKEELRKCYLATPYVDYLKELEKTKKEDRLLMVQKNYSTFENKLTDISKYCNGFGYANSSCFYNCQNACPSTDPAFLSYIQDCKTQDCDSICAENTIACRAKKSACFIKENNCLAERLLRKETCPNDSSGNFGNFEECIDSCQTECSSDCETKFKSCSEIDKACNDCSSKLDKDSNFPGVCSSISKKYCSDEFEKCQNICKNNSQCIINNKESCIYSPQNLLACATENTDNENKKYCVENSGFTCKYGSSQQAGYADCLKNPYSLGNKFTSSEIYKNQFQQKCPAPYLTDPSSSCYSSSSPNSSCIDVCPEVSKCPSASNCPKCPCNTTSIDTNPSNFNSKGKAFYSVYVHMKNISVTIGQVVNQGDIIGQISNIGTDTGSHLHFAVGFENGKTGLDVATSFDISSKVTASGMSGIGSGYTAPLPTYVNENYKNYVLNSLTPPVNTNQCDWKQNPGSYLHNNTASYAQDWICNNGSQEGSNVQVMAGGDNIKSTVSGIVPASGAVIIKHEVNENILSSLINSIISDYQIVGGECQEYKYNDDPLTFYCKQDWWNEPALQAQEPLANSYICPKEKEIPVGQAVDDTQFWAKKLSAYQSDFALKTDELINHLIKISKEKEYCKCGSTCGSRSSEKTCNAPCVPELLTDPVTGAESCVCANQGCQGNPCQYIINLLMGSTGASCPKGEIIKGPLQFYNELKSKLKTIYDFMQISRTDIIKELIYSRKTMNTCSVESKANTVAEQTRLESCRRVRNNFVSPIADDKTTINNQEIKYPCYGVDLGEIYGDTFSSSTTKEPIIPETDNWFCCVPRD